MVPIEALTQKHKGHKENITYTIFSPPFKAGLTNKLEWALAQKTFPNRFARANWEGAM